MYFAAEFMTHGQQVEITIKKLKMGKPQTFTVVTLHACAICKVISFICDSRLSLSAPWKSPRSRHLGIWATGKCKNESKPAKQKLA